MKYNFRILILSSITVALIGATSLSSANVWIDENFDGVSTFVQGDGIVGNVPGATLDTLSVNALVNPVSSVLTQTGSVETSKFYGGTASYKIDTGETLAVATPYQDQGNGNFQYMQFAVNVDPIPAAGTVGEFRWEWTVGTPSVDYSLFVRLESDGSQVSIIAGEDKANSLSQTIDTLTDADNWTYITIQVQKDPAAQSDPRDPNLDPNMVGVTMPQGVNFYSSSNTPAYSIQPFAGTPPFDESKDWAITVNSGSVFIDDLYWDGGIDSHLLINSGSLSDQNLRPFDSPKKTGGSAVEGWEHFD